MIVGIGNDIVAVSDIEQSIRYSPRFLERVFCKIEREYCNKQVNCYQHFAGCFAVKEAVMKALGTGWNLGIQWNHIEITHNPTGKPEVFLLHNAKKRAELLQFSSIHVSLSHTEQYAAAVAILER